MNIITSVLLTLTWILAPIVTARAVPAPRSLTSTLLFNAAASQDPNTPSDTIALIEVFEHIFESKGSDSFNAMLKDILGEAAVHEFDTALNRTKLFAAVGIPLVHQKISVEGCSGSAKIEHIGIEDLGIVSKSVSLGSCSFAQAGSSSTHTAQMTTSASGSQPATIFYSPPGGLGVISDIDDTIKVTDVLNRTLVIENTLYKGPDPVAGMPELYSSLAQSLTTTSGSESIPPQFLYVSGSPLQLYPFLSDFLSTHFSASNGPIFLQNLSITDLKLVFDSFGGEGTKNEAKVDYKVGQINKIISMYPKKSFLAVGDSTEMDPEVYGKIYNAHPGSIRCIWIHDVPGSKDSGTRFEAAFKGVPKGKYRIYKDNEIAGLKDVDVAGGKC